MLTYKQLLQKCDRELLNKFLLSRTLEDMRLKYSDKNEEELLAKAQSTVTNGYGHVIDKMLTKEGTYPKYAIILDLVPEEKWFFADQEETTPAYITVNYYNSRTEPLPKDSAIYEFEKEEDVIKYNKFLGFGLCKWADYVDCDVVITPDAVAHLRTVNILEKMAVEILWEQTFYGFSEENVTNFVNELSAQVEGIKSGKVKTKLLRKKKKGEKYDIRIADNLLAPCKKKRTNKKKK